MARAAKERETEGKGPGGLSLKAKFALVVILALSALVSGSITVVYHLALQRIDSETDKRGVSQLSTLAALGTKYWNEAYVSGLAEDGHNKVLLDYTRLKASGNDVFNLILYPQDATAFLASALPGKGFAIEQGVEGPFAADPSVSIRRDCFFVDNKSGARTPARLFHMPVRVDSAETVLKTPKGDLPPVASITLVLNAEAIDEARGELRGSVILTTLLAIGIGAVVALSLAGIVTGPLKLLMKDIRTVSDGNLEHHTRSHSRDEIGELAATFNHMTILMKEARTADLERLGIEHDLELARDIQSNLLPKRLPKLKGMDVHAFYRAAKEVGGDYYDLIPLTAQHLGIAVGDVAGKGVQGSLVMAMTRAVIRAVSPGISSPARILAKANHILAKDLKPGSFVTLCFLTVDVVARTVTLSRAGHNPLLVHHAGTGKSEFLSPGGIALGFDPGPLFEKTIKEITIPLAKGDVVVAYTDGVVESMNPARDQYGSERFKNLIASRAKGSAAEIVKALVADLDLHQGSAPQHDDISIVVLKAL